MSNAEATKLYEAVIEEVITDSRQDFEDSGIDESTLQELRKLWCEKLSQTGVGKFSWDEERNHGFDINAALGQSGPPVVIDDALHLSPAAGLDMSNIPGDTQLSYNTVGSSGGGIQFPMMTPTPKQEYDDNTGLILPQINQTDGTFEFTVYTNNAKETLEKFRTQNSRRSVKQSDGVDDEDDVFNESDDINSDLDDGLDTEKSDEEDSDQEGQIMLCLYDKVQRVKNKWKSNLKEGVANINGRDYVFQKATGENEW